MSPYTNRTLKAEQQQPTDEFEMEVCSAFKTIKSGSIEAVYRRIKLEIVLVGIVTGKQGRVRHGENRINGSSVVSVTFDPHLSEPSLRCVPSVYTWLIAL